MGWWRRDNLLANVLRGRRWNEKPRLAELQLWAVSAGASCLMIDLVHYEVARLAGLIQKLTIDPVEGNLDALMTDGTGRVVVRRELRRPMPQPAVVPGRMVVVEGLALPGGEDTIMLDPVIEPAPLPARGVIGR
jgi:hypothetical protein